MRFLTFLISLTTLFCVTVVAAQKPVQKALATNNSVNISLTSKILNGKSQSFFDVSGLSNGLYAIPIQNKPNIQMEIKDKKITGVYDANGTRMNFRKQTGQTSYNCTDNFCTCTTPEDCDRLINDTQCVPFVDIDGTTICIIQVSKNNNQLSLIKSDPPPPVKPSLSPECIDVTQKVNAKKSEIKSQKDKINELKNGKIIPPDYSSPGGNRKPIVIPPPKDAANKLAEANKRLGVLEKELSVLNQRLSTVCK